LHTRHIDGSAGGSFVLTSAEADVPTSAEADGATSCSGEDVIRHVLLAFNDTKALRLQIEHCSIPSVPRHQLVVRAELDHATVFDNADAIGVANSGESM
jgi:hypothetical protein